MAEKDELVTIHLDEARQYRDRETWRVETIGPGDVRVPRATALRWGLTPVSEAKAEAAPVVAPDAPVAQG
jgi:hypothetical protein